MNMKRIFVLVLFIILIPLTLLVSDQNPLPGDSDQNPISITTGDTIGDLPGPAYEGYDDTPSNFFYSIVGIVSLTLVTKKLKNNRLKI